MTPATCGFVLLLALAGCGDGGHQTSLDAAAPADAAPGADAGAALPAPTPAIFELVGGGGRTGSDRFTLEVEIGHGVLAGHAAVLR